MTSVGPKGRMPRGYDVVKRALDLFGAILLLTLSLPIQLVVALIVRINLGSPVLFRQERPGLGGRIFTLVKFRSMLEPDIERGIVTDASRLTALGRLLRSTSLDELPGLVNVVRGDMSFVGPRPLLVKYLGLYSPVQARRHEVRPGITGLAQVNGRNALDWDARLALDVRYVETRSFRVDAAILARTVLVVFTRRGVSADGEATVGEFGGSAEE